MTLEIGFLLVLLTGMVYLFLTEKLPVDLTAFTGLVILVLCGFLEPGEAFTGFASPAVITMLSIFIVGAALLFTGVADVVGDWVHRFVGGREIPLMVTIMLVAAVLSAFMNNIAATAVLMPAVASISRRAGISPARLFMPLSYAAILGGTTTLVGTPPNIIAAAMLEERGMVPFSLFDFTPIGIALLLTGILFMITIGRKLLPSREVGPSLSEDTNLAQVYQLHERLFSIRIPNGSRLDGKTLEETHLGATLGVQVLGINRRGKKQLAPDAKTVLRAGDVLLVGGRLADLKELLKVQTVDVSKAEPREIPRPMRGVSGFRAILEESSPLIGRTLREVRFRERFGVVVVGIVRGDEILKDSLGNERFEEHDQILAVGPVEKLEALSTAPDLSNSKMGLSALQGLEAYLYLLRIPQTSHLAGVSVAKSRLGELVGVTVAGIIREGETRLAVSPEETIQGGDRLLIAGEPSRVLKLLSVGEVELDSNISEPMLESEEIGVAEALVAPRSRVAGKSLGELRFRDRFGLQVLALWREGNLVRTGLPKIPLRFGDALMLQGPRAKIEELVKDVDFIVLSDRGRPKRRLNKAPYALLGLAVMIGLVVSGFQPIHVAAFTAATLVILTGAIKMT